MGVRVPRLDFLSQNLFPTALLVSKNAAAEGSVDFQSLPGIGCQQRITVIPDVDQQLRLPRAFQDGWYVRGAAAAGPNHDAGIQADQFVSDDGGDDGISWNAPGRDGDPLCSGLITARLTVKKLPIGKVAAQLLSVLHGVNDNHHSRLWPEGGDDFFVKNQFMIPKGRFFSLGERLRDFGDRVIAAIVSPESRATIACAGGRLPAAGSVRHERRHELGDVLSRKLPVAIDHRTGEDFNPQLLFG